jgi:nucleoside-diphosphate-sugar epimerase
MTIKQHTVLITGLRGFTGHYLAAALRANGARVVGLVQGSPQCPEEIACELTDAQAVQAAVAQVRPTHVVHLAALAFVGHADARAFYDVNLFGTLNLLEALAALPELPRKVLIASSANIYGTPGIEVIDESVCPAPVNHYACSKLAMEHMVRTWFDRLPIVMTRPFNYTGIGQDEKFLIPKIVSHFKRHAAKIELGNLDVSRDFSDVRDVAAAYMGLLESDVRSEVFNVCSGKGVALREVLDIMTRKTGHTMAVEVNPAFVRPNEIPVLRGSHHKLTEAIGFAPRHALEDTLAWMLQSDAATGAVA